MASGSGSGEHGKLKFLFVFLFRDQRSTPFFERSLLNSEPYPFHYGNTHRSIRSIRHGADGAFTFAALEAFIASLPRLSKAG